MGSVLTKDRAGTTARSAFSSLGFAVTHGQLTNLASPFQSARRDLPVETLCGCPAGSASPEPSSRAGSQPQSTVNDHRYTRVCRFLSLGLCIGNLCQMQEQADIACLHGKFVQSMIAYLSLTTLRRTRSEPRGARTAMCVQNANDQCVLQFTLLLAAGCVLHRRTSRAIHHRELSLLFFRGLWFYIIHVMVHTFG